MLNTNEIRNIKFSNAVGGYKKEEVDILLDKIEADYEQHERKSRELQAKIQELTSEIETLKSSQNSIQNVLLSAQRLADQIVDEAKTKSQEIIKNAEANIALITAREKELATAFEIKAGERKAVIDKEINKAISDAQAKSDSITAATADSVARQQVLFDKMRLEVAAFKADVTKRYKEHLEVLQKLPEAVDMDPKRISEAVSFAIDKAPKAEDFIKSNDTKSAQKLIEELENKNDASVKVDDSESGFVINAPETIIDEEEID